MIQGLDPLGASPLRHEAIYLEGRGTIAQPEQARQLALPATQVVQAADAAVGGQVRTGLPGSVAQATATPVEPPRYTLGQAFAAAQAMALAAPGSPAGASEVMRLMQQAPSWGELLRLLQALTQSGTLNGSGEAANLAGGGSPGWAGVLGSLLGASFAQAVWPLRGDRLARMGGLSGEGLKQAMSGGGWATEALLMAGTSGVDHDIKVMMRRLLRGLQGHGGGAAGEALQGVLQRGVDDLERGQLETLTAQMQGQLLLQFVIPFGDGGPVALRIFRDRAREEDPDPEFVVDMHSRHSGLGPIWLRTAIQPAQRVALAMWAESAAVARTAREHASDLRLTLAQQGLRLVAFDIHQGPRPVQDDVFLSQAQREAAA